MVRSRYPYLVQQRHRWFVRMVVPLDVRNIIGQAVFKVATGHSDQHQAAAVAAQIVNELQDRIRIAREAGRRLEQFTAEQLAERYRAEREIDPDGADATILADVIRFVLEKHGQRWVDHAKRVREAGYDVHTAVRVLPSGDNRCPGRRSDHRPCDAVPDPSRKMETTRRTETSSARSGHLVGQAVRSGSREADRADREQRRSEMDRGTDQSRWGKGIELENRDPQARRNSELLAVDAVPSDCARQTKSFRRSSRSRPSEPPEIQRGTSSAFHRR